VNIIVCIKQVPGITDVNINPEAGTIKVERLLEEGREIVEAKLPALLTVVRDINQPRATTISHIRRASSLSIPIWTAADVDHLCHR
jgi:electron transfer flavoprotein alpha/beta subunit